MKVNAIIRIVVFSLAIVILSGILVGVLDQNCYLEDGKLHHYKNAANDKIESVLNQDTFPTDIHNIEIEWVAGSITIQPDEHAQSIHVTEQSHAGAEYETVIKQSGRTLKIQFCEDSMKFPSFGLDVNFSKDLTITVPADWNCNTIEIDAAATEVDIHNIQMNELDFDGASGNLILDNCSIVEMEIDTASGDVEFSGTLKDLNFDAASARFRGEFFQMPNQLNMKTMSGDLDIVLPDYCPFTCELDTISGSFDTDFATTRENDIYIHGNKDNACHIKISAMSGDVSILKGITEN